MMPVDIYEWTQRGGSSCRYPELYSRCMWFKPRPAYSLFFWRSNVWMMASNERERMWKVVVAWFQVLSRHSPSVSGENVEHLQLGYAMSLPRFKPEHLENINHKRYRRVSSVGVATGWMAGVWFPAEVRSSSLLHSVQTDCVAYPASCTVGAAISLHSGKVARAWSCTLTSPYVFMRWCLID
jgi:hypothetical protein